MKIKRNEFCGYLFVICIMFFYSIDKGREYINGVMVFGLLVGIIGIIISIRMQLKTFLLYVGFSIIPIVSYIKGHDTRVLVLLVAMLCGITLDLHKVVVVMFYTKLICFVAMLLVNGYGHINVLALHGGILLLLFICKNEGKIRLPDIVFMLFIYLLLAVYTHSGAFMVCAGMGLAASIIFRNKKAGRFLDSLLVKYIYLICLFANYFFAAGVGEEIMPFVGENIPKWLNQFYLNICNILDVATSYRLSLTKYSFARFGVSLLGGNVDYNLLELGKNGYFNLDSGLIWLLQGGGVLLTIGFMALTVLLIRYLLKTEHYNYVIAGIVIAFWAINEDMLLGMGSNFLIIFMGKAVVDFITERKQVQNGYT